MSEKIGNVYLNDEYFIEEDNSDQEYQERLSRIFSEYQENEFNNASRIASTGISGISVRCSSPVNSTLQ